MAGEGEVGELAEFKVGQIVGLQRNALELSVEMWTGLQDFEDLLPFLHTAALLYSAGTATR